MGFLFKNNEMIALTHQMKWDQDKLIQDQKDKAAAEQAAADQTAINNIKRRQAMAMNPTYSTTAPNRTFLGAPIGTQPVTPAPAKTLLGQ